MARMIRSECSEKLESDAEQLLFGVFQKGLSDEYVVFHSLHCLDDQGKGDPRSGELGETTAFVYL